MIIHMIRHGKTIANEKKLYSGFTDLPLSREGQLHLVNLKGKLNYPQGDIYITSGLKRTTETLNILYGKKPDIEIEEFKEINFGDYEMHGYLELLGNEGFRSWIKNFPNEPCPNGECILDLKNRVKIGIKKLEDLNIDTVVMISHGGVIAAIMEEFCDDKKFFYLWTPKNGRGYSILFEDSKIIEYKDI